MNMVESETVRQEVAGPVPQLWQVPASMMCWLTGLAPSGLLPLATGLSASHLRAGNRPNLRPSTLAKVDDHIDGFLRTRMAKNHWAADEIDRYIATAPTRLSGQPCAWQDFVHVISQPEADLYQRAMDLARKIDDLDKELVDGIHQDSPSRYKDAVLACGWLDADDWWTLDGLSAAVAREQFVRADGWHTITTAFRPVVANILLAFLAALDADCGRAYFSDFVPRPLFLDLLPRQAAARRSGSDGRAKLRFDLPVRRLLELSHALYVAQKDRQWPSRPAGRKAIGELIGELDRDVGKLFDGSKKLTLEKYQRYWMQMFDRLPPSCRVNAPLPLLCAALYWQNWLVDMAKNHKLVSVFLFDGAEYLKWWDKFQSGAATRDDAHAWPSWLSR